MPQRRIHFRSRIPGQRTITVVIYTDFADRKNNKDTRPDIICYIPKKWTFPEIVDMGILFFAEMWDQKNTQYILDGPIIVFMWRFVLRYMYRIWKTDLPAWKKKGILLTAELQNNFESNIHSAFEPRWRYAEKVKEYWQSKIERFEHLENKVQGCGKLDTSSGDWFDLLEEGPSGLFVARYGSHLLLEDVLEDSQSQVVDKCLERKAGDEEESSDIEMGEDLSSTVISIPKKKKKNRKGKKKGEDNPRKPVDTLEAFLAMSLD